MKLQFRRWAAVVVVVAGAAAGLRPATAAASGPADCGTTCVTLPSTLVSGPTGPMVNGWYTAQPEWLVHEVCGTPQDQQIDGTESIAVDYENGRHHIRVLSDNKGSTAVEYDGALNPYDSSWLQPCEQNVNIDDATQRAELATRMTTVLWEGDIGVDISAPHISITAPPDASNSTTSSVTVSGTIDDKGPLPGIRGTDGMVYAEGSGVRSVVVNGVPAVVTSDRSAFHVTLPLHLGLNAINAVATDAIGKTASDRVVVNRLSDPGGGNDNAQGSQPAPTAGAHGPSPTPAPTPTAIVPGSPDGAAARPAATPTPAPAALGPVTLSGARSGVIVIGDSVLVTIILLLVLDRLRLIQVRFLRRGRWGRGPR